ncbi:unnamed protein product [Calypogeia fissa]
MPWGLQLLFEIFNVLTTLPEIVFAEALASVAHIGGPSNESLDLNTVPNEGFIDVLDFFTNSPQSTPMPGIHVHQDVPHIPLQHQAIEVENMATLVTTIGDPTQVDPSQHALDASESIIDELHLED